MKITSIILLLILFVSATTDTKVDRIGVPGPLVFNQTNFQLSWSSHPNDRYFIQEYLPGKETSDSFKQMMTINLLATDISLKEVVALKVQELEKRRETDKTCHYSQTESPDGKEFLVDFLMGENKDDHMTIAEFNVYRYKQIDLGKGNKGILVYAYTKRAYDDGIVPFYKNLKNDRNVLINQMISTTLPLVKIE